MVLREVLIVEDDASTRELLVAITARHGCHAVQCGDGRSAEALLSSHVFDAVLLDLYLPGVSGLELLASLAAANPAVLPRVVVITAASPRLWERNDAIRRVQAVIRKPFELADVENALARCWS